MFLSPFLSLGRAVQRGLPQAVMGPPFWGVLG